ncbi:MAG: carbohydrate kinase family protein [Deltaproteobacteria bacterium]|jgi:adenosine kinase|nr:carbohydrate kinase family protein [Deltaproteobacteria bacterium]
MNILISGSLAFDRLASYPGLFKDSILEGRLDILNISFVVDSVERVHGGTAGNIAYNLSLLGEKPLILSSLGKDPDGGDYLRKIQSWGLSVDGINLSEELPTAGCYIATDRDNNQLAFFHSGALDSPSPFQPEKLPSGPGDSLALVGPGGREDMLRLSREYRRLKIPFILDPGQQIPVFTGSELLSMLEGALLLITNEYELDLFLQKTALKQRDLFSLARALITTFGSRGSRLLDKESERQIAAVPVTRALSPTGAGDAYRGGLLKGLSRGLPLLNCCRLGAVTAAYCVEAPGTQGQVFTLDEVKERYRSAFQEELPLAD